MNKNKSLADKISGLLNTAPSYNPDEQNDTESSAKVVDYEHDEENNSNVDDEHALSAFRKQNISLLDEVDNRYAGKRGSRKDLLDSDDDLELEHIDQESDSSPDEDDDEEDSGEDENDDMEDDELNVSNEENDSFKHIKDSNVKAINKKGISVQNQIRMWESLLEMRIQLQKCLVASNRLPEPTVYKEMKQTNEFAEKSEGLKKTLSSTLGNMLELQKMLIKKFPESKNVFKDKPKRKSEEMDEDDEDNEEILSDTDAEDDNVDMSDEDESDAEKPPAKKKKFSTDELETQLNKLHNSYKPFRNDTIQKWNEKTQIGQGKNTHVNSVINQIEHNLNDKTRLIKRTQLKRSEYKILGAVAAPVLEDEDNLDTDLPNNEYNNNIFDDDDFYHQLLRELIEVKSADITDPIQLSRQWIQLQNLRSKMKRKIDTKATKGRKIRYGIHTKLVNFMAPIVSESITDEAQTELFTSLFGKKIC